MPKLLMVILVLATVGLNIYALIIQSPSDNDITTKNLFTKKISEIHYNRLRSADNNNDRYLPTYNTMRSLNFLLSSSEWKDRSNRMVFRAQRFRRKINTEISQRDRHLYNHKASLIKKRILQDQFRKNDMSIQHERSPNTENKPNFIITDTNNRKVISLNSGTENSLDSQVSAPTYNQTGIISLNLATNERNTFAKRNAGLNIQLAPLLLNGSNEFQQVKTVSPNRNDYNLYTCSCEGIKCDYSGCNLQFVPQDLPTRIKEFFLNSNKINVLSVNVFARYIYLEILDLSYNIISVLEEDSFLGLSSLKYLDLSNNIFMSENVLPPVNIFEPLKSLKILRMDANFELCPKDPIALDLVLSFLENVEVLYVDNYINPEKGEIFGPGFVNMSSLRKLTIKCASCPLYYLMNSTFIFLSHVTSLDIKMCDIEGQFIQAGTFSYLSKLETLDISKNKRIGMEYLPLVTCGLNSSKFQTLKIDSIVNERSITIINNSVTECMPKTLTTLSVRGNNIMFIDRKAVFKLPTSLKTIDIRDNSIFTNPDDIPLEHFVGLQSLIVSSNRGECATNDGDMSLQTTLGKRRSHKYKTHKFTTEHKINSVLPRTLTRVKIAVENMNEDYLLHIDEENNLQEIDLSCSYLPEITFESFAKLRKLKSINVRKSSVRMLIPAFTYDMNSLESLNLDGNHLNYFVHSYGSPFNFLVNLLHLDLSLNQLKHLPRDLFYGLEKLEHLGLNNNSFYTFDVDISNITNLKLLNLSNTEVSQLPGHVRAHIDQLCKVKPGQVRIDMSGCPIQCDCFNLDFLKWMVRSQAFDKNSTSYKCKYPDTSSKNIEDGYKETIRVLERECAKNYPMFLIVLAATSVLMSTVIGAIGYRFRWKIRYFYYAAYLKIMDKHKNDNQHEFVYDVFISYDSEDSRFIIEHLAPAARITGLLGRSLDDSKPQKFGCVDIIPITEIEEEELENRGLKLLIHGRDFVAGSYITSNIVSAVSESRKTLVVLTRNLLESDWCNYEIQTVLDDVVLYCMLGICLGTRLTREASIQASMANMESVYTGRPVLVFLLKEDIPCSELDLDLLRHIRSKTYIPFPDPEDGDTEVMKRFYDKLAHDLQR